MTRSVRRGQARGPARRIHVEFLIDGELSDAVLASFPELAIKRGPAGGSLLYGIAVDRAHLDGLLERFRGLDIPVVEFRQLPE
jgi:hypothetical protein